VWQKGEGDLGYRKRAEEMIMVYLSDQKPVLPRWRRVKKKGRTEAVLVGMQGPSGMGKTGKSGLGRTPWPLWADNVKGQPQGQQNRGGGRGRKGH